jgi:hypothetical protein
MKYWRVIRYYVGRQYNITQPHLELLLFLYSEGYFSKDKFKEFDNLISWNYNRFSDLRRDGWIELFRKKVGNYSALYQLTDKAKRAVRCVYDKLEGRELAEHPDRNPMFQKGACYTDKVYRNMIKKMNESIRQQRRHVPVSPYKAARQQSS